MARAAVRAKQAQAAQAQAAIKPSRKQRKHAAGGNPNQDLFFMRLRRKQKWVFSALAIVFAVSFVFLGVGSGNGNGLQSLWNSVLGTGTDPVGQAKAEIQKNAQKGYQDLANAYVTQGNLPAAIAAMQSYVKLKPKDSNAWSQIGQWQQQIASKASQDYQAAQQNGQLQSPGTIFQPTGPLAGQLGSNPIDQFYSQQNQTATQPLLQKVIAASDASLAAFQSAAKYAPAATRAAAYNAVYNAAKNAGNQKAMLGALQQYVRYTPNAPGLAKIEAQCKALGGTCVPKSTKK